MGWGSVEAMGGWAGEGTGLIYNMIVPNLNKRIQIYNVPID